MNLAALCQRAIVTVDAHRPLREAARAMLEHHVGAVVVTSSSDGRPEVVGVLTDRDLAIACVARALDPAQVLAGAVASRPAVCIAASRGPAEAVEAMRAAGVRRLLVRDDERQLVGLLSSDDLLGALLDPLGSLVKSYGTGIEHERTRSDGATCDVDAGPLFLRQEQMLERD